MTQNYVAKEFTKRFDKITTTLEFDPTWHNGTGYFDKAARTINLEPGHEAKAVADDGRKLIFIGTNVGTCVVFERELGENRRICRHLNNAVEKLVGTNMRLDEEHMRILLGDECSPNIGVRLEELFSNSNKAKKMEKPSLKDIVAPANNKIRLFAERVVDLAKLVRSDTTLVQLLGEREARIHQLTNGQFIFSTVDPDGTTFGEEGVVLFLFDKDVSNADFVASVQDWKNTAAVLGNDLVASIEQAKLDMYDVNVFDLVFSQTEEMKNVRTIARFDL